MTRTLHQPCKAVKTATATCTRQLLATPSMPGLSAGLVPGVGYYFIVVMDRVVCERLLRCRPPTEKV